MSVWLPHAALIPIYWNRAWPVRLPYPSSFVSTPAPITFGGFGLRVALAAVRVAVMRLVDFAAATSAAVMFRLPRERFLLASSNTILLGHLDRPGAATTDLIWEKPDREVIASFRTRQAARELAKAADQPSCLYLVEEHWLDPDTADWWETGVSMDRSGELMDEPTVSISRALPDSHPDGPPRTTGRLCYHGVPDQDVLEGMTYSNSMKSGSSGYWDEYRRALCYPNRSRAVPRLPAGNGARRTHNRPRQLTSRPALHRLRSPILERPHVR